MCEPQAVTTPSVDAVVVGAGPNGLAAAITLAEAGLRVQLYEAADMVGGGARTGELTLPGFRHDLCSAVHPFAAGSPVFTRWPLGDHGLTWLEPDLPLAHPLDDGTAAVLARSVDETAESLGRGGRSYRAFVGPFVGRWPALVGDALRPILSGVPRHPLLLARFGARALLPVAVTNRGLGSVPARALVSGIAGHMGSPLTRPVTAGPALMLALAGHEVGWPVPQGGAQAIADALASFLRSLGGEITTGSPVTSLEALPAARAYVLDTSPETLVALAGGRLSERYTRRLARFRRGPGVFKVDYALREPVPWRAPAGRQAGTLHLGGSARDLAVALAEVHAGRAPERPLVISAQPSVVDPTRAPPGRHTFWAYAHVPNGWTGDLSDAIEAQIERFAPGFRDVVLARAATGPADLERRDANLVGGDLAGGAVDGWQALFRPTFDRVPYATPDPRVFLCSSSTPPGPGVHGICGSEAARVVLRRVFGQRGHRPNDRPASEG